MSVTVEPPRFQPGMLMITRNAQETLPHSKVNAAINRHLHSDWGNLCDSDKWASEDALKHGGRLLSVYHGNIAPSPQRTGLDVNCARLSVLRFWAIISSIFSLPEGRLSYKPTILDGCKPK